MSTLVLGNILSFLGCSLMVGVGFIKRKNKILFVQVFQFVLQALANLVLGAINGVVCGIVSIARNIVFSKVKVTAPLKIAFILVQFLLSVGALKNGAIEILPVISGAIFTWFLDSNNEITLKKAIICSQVLWLIYDFSFQIYVGACFDFLTICSNAIGIYMLRSDAAKQRSSSDK